MSQHVLTLKTWPKDGHFLHQTSREVTAEELKTIEMQHWLDDLEFSMYCYEGLGLSAIQVGKPLRIFVMDTKAGPQFFINPVIVDLMGVKEKMHEGCLSFPDYFDHIERNTIVLVKYLDRHGLEHQELKVGIEAQCVQHEIEHLDGKVMADKLGPAARAMLASKMRKRGS